MVQKQPQPQRGRPRRFDEDDVIAKAMTAFWTNGFEATTLDQLETATGVDRSTIYNSFGGKQGLYDKAVSAYADRGLDELNTPLSDGTAGLDDVIEFLDRLEAIQTDSAMPRGCLIMNDLIDPTNRAVSDAYMAALRLGLEQAVARSNTTDDTYPLLNSARAETLFAAIIGVTVANRDNGDIHSPTINGLRQLVRSWAGD